MTKRIVSGIFILTALGALGVILAGALSSGEQLIVRFLTAVIVAALGLYVISDLRLQADGAGRATRPRRADPAEAPPNSTAAFMATVTKKHQAVVPTGPPAEANHGEQTATITSPAPSVLDDIDGLEDLYDGAEQLTPTPPEVTHSDQSDETEHIGSSNGDGMDDDKEYPVVAASALESTVDDDTELAEAWSAIPENESTTDLPTIDELADDHSGTDTRLGSPAYLDELELTDHQWPSKEADGRTASDNPVDSAVNEQQRTINDPSNSSLTDIDSPAPDTSSAMTGDVTEEPADAEGADSPDPTGDGQPADAAGQGEPIEATDHDETADSSTVGVPLLDEELLARAIVDQPTLERNHTGDHLPANSQARETKGLPVLASIPGGELQAADYADAPLAPIIDLREVHAYPAAGSVDVAIKAGEVEVIATLIEQGMLSTDGPISDRDVRTMVYVAFTSNELRKLLLAGGSPEGPNDELDLGPVELFDERAYAPTPQRLYISSAPERQTQLG